MTAAKKAPADLESREIFRCDTIPPPDGEESAYSAETKVGKAPGWVLEAMRFTAPSVNDEIEQDPKPQSGIVAKVANADDLEELEELEEIHDVEEIVRALPPPAPVAIPRLPAPPRVASVPPAPVFNVPIARYIPVQRTQNTWESGPFVSLFATEDVNRKALLILGAVVGVVLALSGVVMLFDR
jgi:hypothetical protein